MDLEDVQTVVEVLAKRLPRDARRQVAIGGGDDAHVGFERAGAAHALELPLPRGRAGISPARAGSSRRSRRGRACHSSACSIRPILVAIAPVNAPFSCPNSSDSRSCSGSAAQLIATNGLPARGEPWWMRLEITSLPVPDSPVINTVVSEAATRPTVIIASFHDGETPMMRPCRATRARGRASRRSPRVVPRARATPPRSALPRPASGATASERRDRQRGEQPPRRRGHSATAHGEGS